MRGLMWFRTDLRTADNPALHAACRRSDRGVVAVYTICPKQWKTHDTAAKKVDFVLRHLAALSEALARKNVALRVVETPTFEGVPRALGRLAKEHDCDALFFFVTSVSFIRSPLSAIDQVSRPEAVSWFSGRGTRLTIKRSGNRRSSTLTSLRSNP